MEPLHIDELRKRKIILKEEIISAINKFRKDTGLKIIKVNYELKQEEGGYVNLRERGESSIKPGEINIKLEDI
jgi:hypothetical protein